VSEDAFLSQRLTPETPSFVIGLAQLRLVGALLIVRVLFRTFTLVILAIRSPVEALHAPLLELCNWLIALPLGLALYFLGAGQNRFAREKKILVFLYQALRPLALAVLALTPLLITLSLDPFWSGLSPQLRQMESLRVVTAIGMCLVTGAGIFLLHRQFTRYLAHYRVTIDDYFGSRPLSRRKKRRVKTR